MRKGGIFMSIKLKRLLVIYTAAALMALSGYSYAAARQLKQIRLTAGYESARAPDVAHGRIFRRGGERVGGIERDLSEAALRGGRRAGEKSLRPGLRRGDVGGDGALRPAL